MIFSPIYNLGMSFASALLPVAKLFGGKAALLADGHQRFRKTVAELTRWRSTHEKVIWFHCASLGEFEQGRPVLEAFREKNPGYGVLLTFFSPSGYEVRKNYPLADFVCYLPWDTPGRAKAFVAAARPDKVVFVKYEFWPNMIGEIKRAGAVLIGISVIFRKDQAFFKPWGRFFRKVLARFDFLFVQNELSGELLKSIGYQNFRVVGDTRFDRVIATANDRSEVPGIRQFIRSSGGGLTNELPLSPRAKSRGDRFSASLELTEDNSPGAQDLPETQNFASLHPELPTRNSPPKTKVLVAGSVWPEDMEVLKPFIAARPEMKFIIAPHDIKPEQISGWVKETGGLRYSEIEKYTNEHVLYIDSIGLLARLYKYAGYAFVGGGFRTGLHNILEPAVFGLPVFFGDQKYKKFQEAKDLLELGVAFTVHHNPEEVFDGLDTEEIRRKAEAYVSRNAGATDKILDFLK